MVEGIMAMSRTETLVMGVSRTKTLVVEASRSSKNHNNQQYQSTIMMVPPTVVLRSPLQLRNQECFNS